MPMPMCSCRLPMPPARADCPVADTDTCLMLLDAIELLDTLRFACKGEGRLERGAVDELLPRLRRQFVDAVRVCAVVAAAATPIAVKPAAELGAAKAAFLSGLARVSIFACDDVCSDMAIRKYLEAESDGPIKRHVHWADEHAGVHSHDNPKDPIVAHALLFEGA